MHLADVELTDEWNDTLADVTRWGLEAKGPFELRVRAFGIDVHHESAPKAPSNVGAHDDRNTPHAAGGKWRKGLGGIKKRADDELNLPRSAFLTARLQHMEVRMSAGTRRLRSQQSLP